MKCRILALLGVAAIALAQYTAPYSEAQLRDVANRYGNAYFETINPVGTSVLLQNQVQSPGFGQPYQTEWLTIYDNNVTTIAPQSCGNGVVEGYELCDLLATNWLTANPTCAQMGFANGPVPSQNRLACNQDCTWNPQAVGNTFVCGATTNALSPNPPGGNCGDGVVNAPFEQCDIIPGTGSNAGQINTNGQTCQSVGLGFTGGFLGCRKNPITTFLTCQFDFSQCTRSTPGCGDGKVTGVEQCDIRDPNSAVVPCTQIGLTGGNAYCSPTCDWDVGYCAPYSNQVAAGTNEAVIAVPPALPVGLTPLCGNNQIDIPEQCDGYNLQNQTCWSLGFSAGTLNCSNCRYDTRACVQQGGLVTVAAVGPNVTLVHVGEVVALNASIPCNAFGLNNFNTARQQYCLVDQSAIAVSLREGNLFFHKSDVTTQAGYRNTIPASGDWEARSNF